MSSHTFDDDSHPIHSNDKSEIQVSDRTAEFMEAFESLNEEGKNRIAKLVKRLGKAPEGYPITEELLEFMDANDCDIPLN